MKKISAKKFYSLDRRPYCISIESKDAHRVLNRMDPEYYIKMPPKSCLGMSSIILAIRNRRVFDIYGY